jgi:hypothetical protein
MDGIQRMPNKVVFSRVIQFTVSNKAVKRAPAIVTEETHHETGQRCIWKLSHGCVKGEEGGDRKNPQNQNFV